MQRGLTKLGLTEIRIAGFGGQGVILAAAVIGKAAARITPWPPKPAIRISLSDM